MLFDKKLVYDSAMREQNENNLVDFTIGEKFLYGRIKRNSVPIILIRSQNLNPIKFSSDPRSPTYALNFVTDVFDEMANVFKERSMTGQLSSKSEFLNNLTAYSAYTNPVKEYNNYRAILQSQLKDLFSSGRLPTENFDQFTTHLLNIMKNIGPSLRFTLPGYVKSRDCPVMSTGLCIEVAENVKYSNNDEKIKKFVEDPNCLLVFAMTMDL